VHIHIFRPLEDYDQDGYPVKTIAQFMMKEGPTKCISKANHMFRISILLLHVSALQERHLQGAQSILMKLCLCYVISAE
jgi:hypothetical protein